VRYFFICAVACVLPLAAQAQGHVSGAGDNSVIPVLRGERPTLDRDLQMALQLFNGQNALDMSSRTVGVVEQELPDSLLQQSADDFNDFIAEGVVLRTDAYLAPDRTGMVTVLTVLPTAILRAPPSFPPPVVRQARRGPFVPVPPPRPAGSILRFAMAGGTVYFDDNNGATLRQAGVRYPAPGESLMLFGQTIGGENGQPGSSVLQLTAACVLQRATCASIDGDPVSSDMLTDQVPGGITTAQAYNAAGAPIADRSREGMRGVAGSVESHYNLGQGDVRLLAGPEIAMPPFVPAAAGETVVRAHVLSSDATLTLGGLGVVTRAIAAVDKLYSGTLPGERTLDITQRGGLLWKDGSTVLAALNPAQQPLVESGDYFLVVGRTTDNRWELREAWRVVDDEVFALDRSRAMAVKRDSSSYWESTAAFLKAHGVEER
jgi:hypothetical protein